MIEPGFGRRIIASRQAPSTRAYAVSFDASKADHACLAGMILHAI